MKNAGIVAIVVLVAVLALLLFGGAGMGYGGFGMMGPRMMGGYGMMGSYGGGYGFGMMSPIGGILSVALLALIVACGAFLVVSLLRGAGQRTSPTESALDILKTRYAKGELSKQQFDEMKTALGG
jgi:putative membrane protein